MERSKIMKELNKVDFGILYLLIERQVETTSESIYNESKKGNIEHANKNEKFLKKLEEQKRILLNIERLKG